MPPLTSSVPLSERRRIRSVMVAHCDPHCRMPCSYLGMVPSNLFVLDVPDPPEYIVCPLLEPLLAADSAVSELTSEQPNPQHNESQPMNTTDVTTNATTDSTPITLPPFVPFESTITSTAHKPRPPKMLVGETVVRRKPLSHGASIYLRQDMRKCTREGMAFSVAENDTVYAIRRDK